MSDEGQLDDLEEPEGFDPVGMDLELSRAEKRRTTAVLMAILAYKELIIRDADMLREVRNMERNDEGPKITTATVDRMIEAAMKFDKFIETGAATVDFEERVVGRTSSDVLEKPDDEVEVDVVIEDEDDAGTLPEPPANVDAEKGEGS